MFLQDLVQEKNRKKNPQVSKTGNNRVKLFQDDWFDSSSFVRQRYLMITYCWTLTQSHNQHHLMMVRHGLVEAKTLSVLVVKAVEPFSWGQKISTKGSWHSKPLEPIYLLWILRGSEVKPGGRYNTVRLKDLHKNKCMETETFCCFLTYVKNKRLFVTNSLFLPHEIRFSGVNFCICECMFRPDNECGCTSRRRGVIHWGNVVVFLSSVAALLVPFLWVKKFPCRHCWSRLVGRRAVWFAFGGRVIIHGLWCPQKTH